MPTPYAWVEDISPRSADPPFDEKPDERLLWRGRNTGIHHSSNTLWKNAHRDYFVRMANEIKGTIEIVPPNVTREEKIGEPRTVRKARFNPALLDVSFVDVPFMCSGDTCDELERLYPFKPFQSTAEAGQYKYVFDVSSPSAQTLCITNMPTLRSTEMAGQGDSRRLSPPTP